MKPFAEMTGPEKWAYLNESLEGDAASEKIIELAKAVRTLGGGRGAWEAKIAMALARDCVEYLTDHDRKGAQDFDPAEETWGRGVDACHGKARLFVALCRACGLGARLEPVWQDTKSGVPALTHVFCAVCLNGAWLPVDPTAARARLGERLQQVPKEASGKWLK